MDPSLIDLTQTDNEDVGADLDGSANIGERCSIFGASSRTSSKHTPALKTQQTNPRRFRNLSELRASVERQQGLWIKKEDTTVDSIEIETTRKSRKDSKNQFDNFSAQRDRTLATIGRKRPLTTVHADTTPRKSRNHAPFDVSSSDDENDLQARSVLMRARGPRQASDLKTHRYCQRISSSEAANLITQSKMGPSIEPTLREESIAQTDTRDPVVAVVDRQTKREAPEDDGFSFDNDFSALYSPVLPSIEVEVKDDEGITPTPSIPPMTVRTAKPEPHQRPQQQPQETDELADHTLDVSSTLQTHIYPDSMDAAIKQGETPAIELTEEIQQRRFAKVAPKQPLKTPPKTRDQRWLEQNRRRLKRDVQHPFEQGQGHGIPKPISPSAPHSEPTTQSLLPQNYQVAVSEVKQTKQLDDGGTPMRAQKEDYTVLTPAPTPAHDLTPQPLSSQIALEAGTHDHRDSMISENDRCLMAWKDLGKSWDAIAVEWQRKTGEKKAINTLTRRYKKAKDARALELNGMKIGRKMEQQAQASGPSSPSTVDGHEKRYHDDAECKRREDSTQSQGDRPTTGVKTINNEAWMRRMEELRQIQEEELKVEDERNNGFFRTQSPQPGDDGQPVYFIYRILRREWLDPVGRTDAPFYIIRDPVSEFGSWHEAYKAAMRETTQTRNYIGPHMRFLKTTNWMDENDLYHWSFEDRWDRGYEVKVARELCAHGPGYKEPESMLGYFKKKVYLIKQRVEVTTKTKTPTTTSQGVSDDLFGEENTKPVVDVKEAQVGSIYTTADRANNDAKNFMFELAIPINSRRMDDIKKRMDLSAKLDRIVQECEEDETMFEDEYDDKKGRKVKVWVEMSSLEGPRNI